MNGWNFFIVWMIGIIPSLVFGYGGAILWTVIIIFANEKHAKQYPNRNGSRSRPESIEAQKHLTPRELNLIDRNPTYYKTYWYDRYEIKDASKSFYKYYFKYYRCKTCGHVMKVLIWTTEPKTKLPITNHWCRGCQDYKDVVEIDEDTYNFENRYYNHILRLMQYTGIGDPDELLKLLESCVEKIKNNDCVKVPLNGSRWPVESYYKKLYCKETNLSTLDAPMDGVKEIVYNASKIGEDRFYRIRNIQPEFFYMDNYEEPYHGLDPKMIDAHRGFNIIKIIDVLKEFQQYDFYKKIYKYDTMPVTQYLKEVNKEMFSLFVDAEGVYHSNPYHWGNKEEEKFLIEKYKKEKNQKGA